MKTSTIEWRAAFTVLYLLTILSSQGHAAKKTITVVLRYDDYAGHSMPFEDSIIDILRQYNARATFGVIPYRCAGAKGAPSEQDIPLPRQKMDVLSQAVRDGTLEIAAHGYCHQDVRPDDKTLDTEFAGLTLTQQQEKIHLGKKLLESNPGIQVVSFIPPFNSHDLTTLAALEKLGVEHISADKNRPVNERSTLKFLPKTASVQELRQAVAHARGVPEQNPLIIALFHPYDFLESGSARGKFTLNEFAQTIAWLSSQDDVVMASISSAAKDRDDLAAKRYDRYKLYNHFYNIIPSWSFLKIGHSPYVYLSEKTMTGVWIKFCAFLSALGGGCAVGSFLTERKLRKSFPPLGNAIPWASLAFLVPLIIHALRGHGITAKGFLSVFIAVSLTAGVWLSAWRGCGFCDHPGID